LASAYFRFCAWAAKHELLAIGGLIFTARFSSPGSAARVIGKIEIMRIAIIGGGATGVLAALHLTRNLLN